jgi:hypothetical protein
MAWMDRAADLVVLAHLGFVVFVAAGGLLLLRWPRLLPVHLAAVLWGAVIELGGFICPLTPLENHLREIAGSHGYQGGFVEHYVLPVLYPAALTRPTQIALGCLVLGVNGLVYWWVLRRSRRGTMRATPGSPSGHPDRT